MVVVVVHCTKAKFKCEAIHDDVLDMRVNSHSHLALKAITHSLIQCLTELLKLIRAKLLDKSSHGRENGFGHIRRTSIMCIAFTDSAAILVKILAKHTDHASRSFCGHITMRVETKPIIIGNTREAFIAQER